MDKDTEKAIRALCNAVAVNTANHEKTPKMSYEVFGERMEFWNRGYLLLCGLSPLKEVPDAPKS